jgi:hypothetical protein
MVPLMSLLSVSPVVALRTLTSLWRCRWWCVQVMGMTESTREHAYLLNLHGWSCHLPLLSTSTHTDVNGKLCIRPKSGEPR